MGAEPKAGDAASERPTQQQLLDAVAQAEQQTVEPRTEKGACQQADGQPPAGGSIVAKSVNSAIGVTELTLAMACACCSSRRTSITTRC
jgi:zinc protease